MDQKHTIPLAIVIAGLMISGAIYLGGSKGPSLSNKQTNPSQEIVLAKISSEDHIYGDPNAPIKVIEYSDTECPFCKVFHNTMTEVVDTYGGKVAWVYRHFPITQLHSKAMKEAEATECAAEQGGNTMFWRYVGKIYETTGSNDTLDPAELPRIAGDLGLDVSAFNTCLSSGKYTQAIQKSVEDAIKAGARGTPYSVIVTKDDKKIVINGAEQLAGVKAKIDSLLK